jgi:hypothetical protein
MKRIKRDDTGTVCSAAAAAPESVFCLLDAAGRPAADPQSVVSIAVRNVDGSLEVRPFDWGICGLIGTSTKPPIVTISGPVMRALSK